MQGTIKKITLEAQDIKGFEIELGQDFTFLPGQFVMLSFDDTKKKAYSVVESKERTIRLIIKQQGEFTTRLFMAKTGDKINVLGPYGRFVLPGTPSDIIFISGGIGVTPLYSMLKSLINSDSKNNFFFFYTSRTKDEMALYDEIISIKDERLKVHLAHTREGGQRVDFGLIKKIVKNTDQCYFYICGPDDMINNMKAQLLENKIDNDKIRSESFC